jgi:hypothetical protein
MLFLQKLSVNIGKLKIYNWQKLAVRITKEYVWNVSKKAFLARWAGSRTECCLHLELKW